MGPQISQSRDNRARYRPPVPSSFAGHFLSVAAFDVVDIEVTTLRAAKRAESLRVSMTQQGRPIFEAVVWVIGDVAGLQHDVSEMPPVPGPAQLRPIEELASSDDPQDRHRFWENFDSRPIDWMPWRRRQPGTPAWREWLRFRPRPRCDDPFVDAARSLLLIDTMGWPAACQPHLHEGQFIAPSLDVAVQFHRLAPQSEWLLVDAVAPVAAHGLIAAQARVWSEERDTAGDGWQPAPLSANAGIGMTGGSSGRTVHSATRSASSATRWYESVAATGELRHRSTGSRPA